MLKEVSWQIGGEQGGGLDSTVEVFNTVASRAGYYVYAYKTFASRIKGGHTDFTTRLGVERVMAPAEGVNLLVALDQETINLCAKNVYPGAIVLAEEAINPQLPEGVNARLLTMPFNKMTLALGNPVMRNNIVLGATSALLGLSLKNFKEYATSKFGRKGEEFVAQIHDAMQQGYDYVHQNWSDLTIQVADGDGKQRLLMIGNEAAALGAVAAGCRMIFSYPITPASEVAETLAKVFPKVGGIGVQMEDELASMAACVGAGYAGARVMTATSGPGVSLMQELLGLASAIEVPLVLVNTQRGGPATGMPTKNEQSDLFSMAYGGHGEGPRIVLAPSSVEDLIGIMPEAFNLADNFHCPVFIASDLALALFQQTVEPEATDLSKFPVIDRGPIMDPAKLLEMGRDVYERYNKADGIGVSPRALPGMKNGQYLATGAEHNPKGNVFEGEANRVYQMDRRLKRLKNIKMETIRYTGSKNADIVLLAFGTTFGAVEESAAKLAAETGKKVGVIQLRLVYPVPVADIQAAIGNAKLMVVESNAVGQFAFMLRGAGFPAAQLSSLLKYDSSLFAPDEVVGAAKLVLSGEAQYVVTGGGAGPRAISDPTIALTTKEA
ncbi:MAG: 2-oxoacid:acceptor oxidoreductase subunit alpha [Mycobacterium leprae]